MKSSKQIGLVVLAAALVVVGFVIMRPGSKQDETAQSSKAATIEANANKSAAGANGKDSSTQTRAKKSSTESAKGSSGASDGGAAAVGGAAANDVPNLEVGSIKTITVHKGDQVRFTASAQDPDEVHVHGPYDHVMKQIPAGGKIEVSFPATHEGVFEIEYHEADTQVAKLKVLPPR